MIARLCARRAARARRALIGRVALIVAASGTLGACPLPPPNLFGHPCTSDAECGALLICGEAGQCVPSGEGEGEGDGEGDDAFQLELTSGGGVVTNGDVRMHLQVGPPAQGQSSAGSVTMTISASAPFAL